MHGLEQIQAMNAEAVESRDVVLAQKVLDNHCIQDHWLRSGSQVRELLMEVLRLSREG